jgi:hypothetical protein
MTNKPRFRPEDLFDDLQPWETSKQPNRIVEVPAPDPIVAHDGTRFDGNRAGRREYAKWLRHNPEPVEGEQDAAEDQPRYVTLAALNKRELQQIFADRYFPKKGAK